MNDSDVIRLLVINRFGSTVENAKEGTGGDEET